MPSYTSKTRLTRLFTRLRQVSTSWWSVVSWDQKRYCYVLFIVNSKLFKTNFPHLWAFSILSPSYHPFMSPQAWYSPDSKPFTNIAFWPSSPLQSPSTINEFKAKSLHVKRVGFSVFPTFFPFATKNEKKIHPFQAHHFIIYFIIWGTLIGSKESKKLRQPPGHGSQLWTSSRRVAARSSLCFFGIRQIR